MRTRTLLEGFQLVSVDFIFFFDCRNEHVFVYGIDRVRTDQRVTTETPTIHGSYRQRRPVQFLFR